MGSCRNAIPGGGTPASLRFTLPISDIPIGPLYDSKLQLEKLSELEVGVLCAVGALALPEWSRHCLG